MITRLGNSQLFLISLEHWPTVLVIAGSLVGQTVMVLLMPWPIQAVIDHIIRDVPTAGSITGTEQGLILFIIHSIRMFWIGSEFDFLYINTGWLCLIIFFNSLFLYVQSKYTARMGQVITLEVRRKLFTHLINLPQSFFDRSRSGDLTNRISKDTAELSDIFEAFLVIGVKHVPTVLGILVIVFRLDTVYALTFVVVIPVIYVATSYFVKKTKNAMRSQRRIEGDLASTAQEAIFYHKAVASHSMEDGVTEELLESGRLSAESGEMTGRFQGLLASIVELIVSLTFAFVLFVGVLRIAHGCLTVGQLTVFIAYLKNLFNPIKQFSKFMGRIAKSLASSERIEEILKLSAETIGVAETSHAVEADRFRGHVVFDRIRFGYTDANKVLDDFCLEVLPGQKVAIVGESGSGKSTLMYLLLRLYDPNSGNIFIDGKNIRQFTLRSLRSQISTVLQDSFLFNSSIRNNIALTCTWATEPMVATAASAAKADDFISRLPGGYDMIIGEGGSSLSGGQRRRIAIARAILCDAPIIILDEPTAGLDAGSEKKVMEALDTLSESKTTLIVTHQLSTVINADRIIVLADGTIVEEGRHDTLLQLKGRYWKLWQDQQGTQSD